MSASGMRALWFCMGASVTMAAPSFYQEFISKEPVARLYKNVNDGTPFNHGQKTIEIKLTGGLKLYSFGGCGPHWFVTSSDKTPAWSSITCDVERVSPKGFSPAGPSSNSWLEIRK